MPSVPLTPEFQALFCPLLSRRNQLALRKEPPSQQGDKDTLQDSEEERGVSSLIVLQQSRSQLEDEAPRVIQVILPSLECSWLGYGSRGSSRVGSVLLPLHVCLLISLFV